MPVANAPYFDHQSAPIARELLARLSVSQHDFEDALVEKLNLPIGLTCVIGENAGTLFATAGRGTSSADVVRNDDLIRNALVAPPLKGLASLLAQTGVYQRLQTLAYPGPLRASLCQGD